MTTSFICSWCQTGDHAPSAMQPAFCTECVHAMLQGRGETRKAPTPTLPAIEIPYHAVLDRRADLRAIQTRYGYPRPGDPQWAAYLAESAPPAAHDAPPTDTPAPDQEPAPLAPSVAAGGPLYHKDIVYDRETRDYAMYLDGELVGFARTYHEAEVTLDQLVYELISGSYFTAARPAEPCDTLYYGNSTSGLDGGEDIDPDDGTEWSYAPLLDVADLLALFQSDPDAAYGMLAALTPEQLYVQALACAEETGKGALAILARWEAGIARRAAPPICDNCPAPATTAIDLIQLCGACYAEATARLLATVSSPVCLSCGDPVEQEDRICEACQEAGEPWPVAQAIEAGRAASGLIPVLVLHAWATTDRPAFRAALAGLTASQLEWQAAVYSAYLTMHTGKTVTTEATLEHFKRNVAIHWSCVEPHKTERTYRLTHAQLNEALRGAIGMYLEYRDIHGRGDDEAQIDGANEILEGLDADRELAANDPTERLRLQLPDATADLLAAAEQAWKALLGRKPHSVPGGEQACEALRLAIAKARGENQAPV